MNALDLCESPIETLLGEALLARIGDDPLLSLQPQKALGPYRVDFVLVCSHDWGCCFVIECDGHDFHERTREQAQRDRRRDRFFSPRGWIVMRFTGSEIWRDAARCADEVFDVIEDHKETWRQESGR